MNESLEEDVRVCDCHAGIFWRADFVQRDPKKVTVHGYATRHSFDGRDLVNTYVFWKREWEALKRV